MLNQTLITILADGNYHSGESLGEALGVSRAAAWKQIKKLTAVGIEVESVKGRGYRVIGGIDTISQFDVAGRLTVLGSLVQYDHHECLSSTNTELLALANTEHFHCTAIGSDMQSNGRGRRGRQWLSPYAENICLSLGWQFENGAASLEGLSLAVGVVVAKTLHQCGVEAVELKWPNDVLISGRKLAGILLEMSGDPSGACSVVVGIGINVHMKRQMDDINQPWISCDEAASAPLVRGQLTALLLSNLEIMLTEYSEVGFKKYRNEWLSMHAYQNKQVTVTAGDTVYVGEAMGVDDAGALQVSNKVGVRVFHGGEVSVRG